MKVYVTTNNRVHMKKPSRKSIGVEIEEDMKVLLDQGAGISYSVLEETGEVEFDCTAMNSGMVQTSVLNTVTGVLIMTLQDGRSYKAKLDIEEISIAIDPEEQGEN